LSLDAQKHHEAVRVAVEAVPAAGVVVYTKVLGYSLNDLAALAGMGLIFLQALYLLWRWRRDARRERRRQFLERAHDEAAPED
jgi:uncharacterized membrane protein YdjX (TVP38/TMEM64 family)